MTKIILYSAFASLKFYQSKFVGTSDIFVEANEHDIERCVVLNLMSNNCKGLQRWR